MTDAWLLCALSCTCAARHGCQLLTCVAWLVVAQASIQLVEGQQQGCTAHAIKLLTPDSSLPPKAVCGCPESQKTVPALHAAQRELPADPLYFLCSLCCHAWVIRIVHRWISRCVPARPETTPEEGPSPSSSCPELEMLLAEASRTGFTVVLRLHLGLLQHRCQELAGVSPLASPASSSPACKSCRAAGTP